MKIIDKYDLFPNVDVSCFPKKKKEAIFRYITYTKEEKEMDLRLHNNDFDMLLRSVHWSAKLQFAKKHTNAQQIKYYLYHTSWVFKISYKLFFS